MFSLSWPWLLLLLPLPLLVRLWPAHRQEIQPLYIATLPHLSPVNPHRRYSLLLLALLAWAGLVLALARPVWLGEPVPLEKPHRDLMLAIDLSDSMRTVDMLEKGRPVNRLNVVKRQLRQFVAQRAGDRIGLILFADHAYLMAPLTRAWQTLQSFIDELDFSMAGYLTSIGEAIGLAIKRFSDEGSRQKLLILLSDGRDTVGALAPVAAAKLAAAQQMRLYTIGLGAEVPLDDPLASSDSNPAADLDEATLQQIANVTGGRYFRARDPESLAAIYQAIDELEPMETSQRFYQPRQELYPYPLLMALLLGLLQVFLVRRRHG